MQTQTHVPTESGQLYLKKLCRHFAHKVPATVTGDQGIIEFPFGRCLIDTTKAYMRFRVDVGDESQVSTAERVIGEHLQRMAPAERLKIDWQRGDA